MSLVTFYASAFTTAKTFDVCPVWKDYTDRNWYYQHSNYRSVVRNACEGLSRHQAKQVKYSLKTQLDAQYEAEVLPVFEKKEAAKTLSSTELTTEWARKIRARAEAKVRAELEAEMAEMKQTFATKLAYEKCSRITETKKAKAFEERAVKAEHKLSVYKSIKVAQAAYMQVVYKIVQKVK